MNYQISATRILTTKLIFHRISTKTYADELRLTIIHYSRLLTFHSPPGATTILQPFSGL